MPSRLLPFLYRLALVHQDYCSSSFVKSRPLLKNELTNAPSVPCATFLVAVIYIVTILVANVIYLATFPLNNSLAADFVPLGTGLPLWHGYSLWCSPRALVSWRLLSGATLPATAGCPLWAQFACGAVSHSRSADWCHPRNSTSLISVVQGFTLNTATWYHTGTHFNSLLSCLLHRSLALLSLS